MQDIPQNTIINRTFFFYYACSNCPFHINNSWIKKVQKMYKKTPQTLPSFKKKSSEELLISMSTSCPQLCQEPLSLQVQFHVMVELNQKLTAASWEQPCTCFSPNPALSSSPHGPSTDCNSTGAYIAAQQAKFSSSQPLPLKRQSAENPKEVSEVVNSGQAVSRA